MSHRPVRRADSCRLFFEFPLATNGQYIVFHANVEVFGIDVRQIRFYDQFMLGFHNIDCGCPSREVGFLLAIEALAKHAVQLLMKRGCAPERFKTVQISHVSKLPILVINVTASA